MSRGTAVHLPTQVEWVLWDGTNLIEVEEFVLEGNGGGAVSTEARNGGGSWDLVIHTRQGDRWPRVGDRIVRGTTQEIYVIVPDVWERTYEDVHVREVPV